MTGWLRTKAIASWMSVIPVCGASWARSSTASSSRWLPGSEVEALGKPPGARRGRLAGGLAPAAGQPAAGERAVGEHADAVASAGEHDAGLDGADEDRVSGLLA